MRQHVLIENARFALQPDEACDRRRGIGLRQQHVDAVGRLQIPAPAGDQHAGADFVAQVAGGVEQRQIFANPLIGAVADDERKIGEAPVAHRVERRAVGGDDMQFAILLPQGGGLALLDLDQQPVGIELGDARLP